MKQLKLILYLFKQYLYKASLLIYSCIFLVIAIPCALFVRFHDGNSNKKPRLVWGSTPIINNTYWSNSMVKAGYESETFTTDFYGKINKRDDWDKILSEEYKYIPRILKPFVAFLHAIFLYEVFFIPFSGFFLGSTYARSFQAQLLKLSKKKVVLLSYGSDSYVYRRVKSTATIHGLLMSYPQASKLQNEISKNVDYWCKYADAVIGGFMSPDGFGRWEVLVGKLFIDTELWKPSNKLSMADGANDSVVIVHAPNHKGIKGSEFVAETILKLKNEGLKIDYRLLEGIQNEEVRRILRNEADILVEQLIFTGHGMNGLEGMASGLPTISNLEDDNYIMPMRRWSYFNECPIVSATPENLTDILRKLITRPKLRHELGKAGRKYVEKYQSLDSSQYLFENVIEYLYGRKKSLINLYHPLLGEYPNRSPKIKHPLINNRIVD